jgi:hypothetical protein
MARLTSLVEQLGTYLQEIEDFKSFWLEGHRHDPDDFPLEMSKGEWDEQFALYIQNNPK